VTVAASLTSNRLLIPVALIVPPDSEPSQTERLVAVSLADQVGAALTEYGARGSQAP
jgi:hypothetical protein